LLFRVDLNFKFTFAVEGEFAKVAETVNTNSNRPDVSREWVVTTLSNYMAFRCSEAGSSFRVVKASYSNF